MTLEPLVLERAAAGRYEVRRRAGTDPEAWWSLAIFLGLGALSLMLAPVAVDSRTARWLSAFPLAMAALWIWVLLRDRFSTVLIEVDGEGVTVADGLVGRVRPRRLSRESIDGFWVQCLGDDHGSARTYALMVDQHATRSRTLFGSVADMGPLVALAETLAGHLRVPSDTRCTDVPLSRRSVRVAPQSGPRATGVFAA